MNILLSPDQLSGGYLTIMGTICPPLAWRALSLLTPKIEKVLKETFGIMIYQEDVTRVAIAIANFNSFEGNELRKILGKKHKEKKLAHYKEKFFSRRSA